MMMMMDEHESSEWVGAACSHSEIEWRIWWIWGVSGWMMMKKKLQVVVVD